MAERAPLRIRLAVVLTRLGGLVAIGSSGVLFLVVLFQPDVGVNLLNGWTIVLCGMAGILAVSLDKTGLPLLLLAMGAVPALPGGVAFLFLPSFCLLLASALLRLLSRNRQVTKP